MIVTIDGPAGAGKSTVARALAQRLGFRYLDTGAMYRAVTLAGMRQGVDWDRPEQLAELAGTLEIKFAGQRVLVDGVDVTEAIRSSAVTTLSRYAADNPEVRRCLVALQRAVAGSDDIVTEGRDQGTLAFPEAGCKFFLTAAAEERARRRLCDLQSQGESAALEEVLAAQDARDRRDISRGVGRLVAASDAEEVCTDGMTLEEVVDRLESLVHEAQRPSPMGGGNSLPAGPVDPL
jgi:cytidylate kinase